MAHRALATVGSIVVNGAVRSNGSLSDDGAIVFHGYSTVMVLSITSVRSTHPVLFTIASHSSHAVLSPKSVRSASPVLSHTPSHAKCSVLSCISARLLGAVLSAGTSRSSLSVLFDHTSKTVQSHPEGLVPTPPPDGSLAARESEHDLVA